MILKFTAVVKVFTCALFLATTIVNANTQRTGLQIDETTIMACVVNNINKEDELKYDLFFEGYNTPSYDSIKTIEG